MPEELKTKTSVGIETPSQTVQRAKKLVGSISASDLANPVSPAPLTPPVEPSPLPSNRMVKAVADETNNIIAAQTEEAKQLKDLRGQFAALGEQGSLSDLYSSLSSEYELPQNMKELKDINLQLTDMQTDSDLTKSRIAGAAGQTLGQGGREITQEDREHAIRSAGLAARAAVLQGNIETASSLVSQAVNIAYQDRTLKNQNLLAQIQDLSGVVDDQTQQLLDKEQRKYEEDQAKIAEIKQAVNAAALSGAASAQEMQQLSDPLLSDEDRLALAQGIVARGAGEERNLDMAAKRASLAQGWESLRIRQEELDLSREKMAAELSASGNLYGTIDGKPQSAAQQLVNSYANRLIEAEQVFSVVADQFADPLAFGGVLPNVLQSDQRQQYEQAKRNFVNSVLRRESGAVISDQEFENAEKQYFPQAGDSEATILQKEQNRNTVINNFYREANVPRPVFAGDIVESDGIKYQVGEDGVTLTRL